VNIGYLLPIINRLLQSKKLNKPKLELSERNLGLKGLVLEPSVELTYQVFYFYLFPLSFM